MERPPIPKELWDTIPLSAQAALLTVFEQMQARIDRLEREVAELKARLGQNSGNSHKPPSSDPAPLKRKPPVPPSGRKRGGQPGHRRAQRTLVPSDQVHEMIECRPACCRGCGEALCGTDAQPQRHQVAELPPVRPLVIEYRLHRLACRRCGRTTRGPLPAGVPSGAFGPRLQAVLNLFSGAYRLGKRPVQQLASDLFGLRISLGMISKLEQRTSALLQRPVAALRRYVRTQSVGVDETGWRENQMQAWLWAAVARHATVFQIARSRGAPVLRELLGKDFRHVIHCDRWRAYRGFARLQWCWAHLRRDFQAMIDRGGSGQPIGEHLLAYAERMFHWWHQVQAGRLARSTFRTYISSLRQAVRDELALGAECGCARTAATCRDLLAHERWLWTFVRQEGIEPTNNHTERTLRHAVLWRKMSGGTDSAAGSRYVERMLSIVATCRQQGQNVLQYLTACCEAALHGHPPPSLVPGSRHRLKAARFDA